MVSGGVLVAVVCGVVVRKQVPEIALVLTLCAAVAVLVAVSGELGLIVGYIQRLAQAGGISQELIAPVMKTTKSPPTCAGTPRKTAWPAPWSGRGRCWAWWRPCPYSRGCCRCWKNC